VKDLCESMLAELSFQSAKSKPEKNEALKLAQLLDPANIRNLKTSTNDCVKLLFDAYMKHFGNELNSPIDPIPQKKPRVESQPSTISLASLLNSSNSSNEDEERNLRKEIEVCLFN